MRRRYLLTALTLTAAGIGSVALHAGPDPGAHLPPPGAPLPSAAVARLNYVGATGCAAAGCHNAQGPLGSEGSEYSTWVHDPHIRAYEVLLEPRSVQMIKNLGDGWMPAHREARCLSCHATPGGSCSDPANPHADGVSCESCHGPAGNWKTTHYQPGWKSLPGNHPDKLGYLDLRDLETRVSKCAGCHVGDADRDVNHDLIAAGHPRLAFEYSAYHQIYPKHWNRYQEVAPRGPYGDDLELKHWAVGQVATAKAAVELLLARAAKADTQPWPEFSEYGCFACHHSLSAPAEDAIPWRRNPRYAGLKVGSLPYGTWYLPRLDSVGPETGLPPLAPDLAAKLAAVMAAEFPDRAAVSGEATAVRASLQQWLDAVRRAGEAGVPQTKALFTRLVADGLRVTDKGGGPLYATTDWEDATQRYLAIAASYQSLVQRKALPPDAPLRDAVLRVRKPLAFPEAPQRFDSPKDFTPARFHDALKALSLPKHAPNPPEE